MSHCHCGRKVVGIMKDGNKPIHEEDGKIFYCEPKFKYGDYVKVKDGRYRDCIYKIISLDSIGYYNIINWNGHLTYELPEDLEKVNVPRFYEEGNRLKIGCVIKLDDGKYVVTNSYKTIGTHSEDYVLKVHAKKLNNNGEYDHNGKDVEFYQRGHIEVLDIKKLSFV